MEINDQMLHKKSTTSTIKMGGGVIHSVGKLEDSSSDIHFTNSYTKSRICVSGLYAMFFVGGDMNLTGMLNELYHAIDIRNL
jgi:hypothetical protein